MGISILSDVTLMIQLGELAGEGDRCSGAGWASGGEQNCTVYPSLCIFIVTALLLFFFSSFAVLLNCLSPNSQVLPFFFRFSPLSHRRGGPSERPHGSWLPAGAKPGQVRQQLPHSHRYFFHCAESHWFYQVGCEALS